MSEMTAIEKAVGAFPMFMETVVSPDIADKARELARRTPNFHDGFSQAMGFLSGYVSALAALEAEKPAEDSALSAVERWADEYYERPVLVGEVHRSLAVAFQSYAHSYHLAECAKCKALPTDDVSEREA